MRSFGMPYSLLIAFLFIMEYYKNLNLIDIIYWCNDNLLFKTEQWKDVIGFEGFYKVSNLGRVKSCKRMVNSSNQFGDYLLNINDKILSCAKNNKGYLNVVLQNKPNKKTIAVHRLVAIVFIDNPENKEQINHKKGIKTDNRASELEWCTHSENQLHSYRVLEKKCSYGNRKLSDKEVIEIRNMYSTGNYSYKKIGDKYGVYKTTIHKIINNLIWNHVN